MGERQGPSVRFIDGAEPDGPMTSRRYTLTHSDITGEMFLSIGSGYDTGALRSLQVRLERDEVLGEWVLCPAGPRLELHMVAQTGLPGFGTAQMRLRIFRRYREMVMDGLRAGDAAFAAAHPELEDAEVVARFHWRKKRETRESWGRWGDYARPAIKSE